MYEAVVTILIFIGVIAVTVLLFGGWLVVALVKGVVRALGGGQGHAGAYSALATTPDKVRCFRARCHAENPRGVRFCRRCGYSLEAGALPHAHARHRPPVRQAAML
jgi:hypothetical protein